MSRQHDTELNNITRNSSNNSLISRKSLFNLISNVFDLDNDYENNLSEDLKTNSKFDNEIKKDSRCSNNEFDHNTKSIYENENEFDE